MKKIKKYSFWTGLSAAVVMLLNSLSKAFDFSIDNQIVEDVIMAICGVLVALGIVCLPVKEEQEEKEEQTKEVKTIEKTDQNEQKIEETNKDNEIK